jgi:TRAP-type C4-dicarboxylate transport system permease small subunit
MLSILQQAGRVLGVLERFLLNLAALTMLVIMGIVVVDVVLRYLFNSPIPWAYPLISRYLMIYLFFLAVADTLRRNEHIFVDLLARTLKVRSRSIPELLGLLPSAVVFALLLWLGIELTWEQYVNKHVEMDTLTWPSWIATVALPISMGAFVLRIVLRIAALGVRIASPEADVTLAYGEAHSEEAAAVAAAIAGKGVEPAGVPLRSTR